MKSINSIHDCQTRSQVAQYINTASNPEKCAAEYAVDCAKDNDCLTIEEIDAHLDFLEEDGAIFDRTEAIRIAGNILKGI